MLPAALALLGALTWGFADFFGGLAAHRLRAVVVTAVAALTGLGLLVVAYPWVGGAAEPDAIVWGALSGLAGALAIMLLYGCLALGPMSVLSPVTAVVSAIAPVVWAVAVDGYALAPIGFAGLVVALAAVALVAFLPGQKSVRPSARGLLMAAGAGLSIGVLLILLDRTSDASGLVPLLVNRTVSASVTFAVVGVLVVVAMRAGRTAASALSTSRTGAGRRAWMWAAACGVIDALANVLMLIALRTGDLAIVSALTAMYPVGTVILAALVLRERIAPLQGVGIALALVAGALLAQA